MRYHYQPYFAEEETEFKKQLITYIMLHRQVETELRFKSKYVSCEQSLVQTQWGFNYTSLLDQILA